MHVASSRILALRLPRVLVLCLPPSWWPHFICRFIWLGTAWASLQSDPTASPGPGPLFPSPQGPAPCLPYLLQFIGAAMAAICEACRKADAVFPFVKSSFWKAVTTLTAIAQGAREWKGSGKGATQRAHTHTHQATCLRCNIVLSLNMLMLQRCCSSTGRTQPRPQSRNGPV